MKDWNWILDDLIVCHEINFDRYLGSGESVELHSFCDSSMRGYDCRVYVRTVEKNVGVKASLVASQSRIAPISKPTIPKLELKAAVLLSKCIHNVVEVLSSSYCIKEVHLNSDSTITLCW